MSEFNRKQRIADALAYLTTKVKLHNSSGWTDINAAAEDLYCGLLNIVLGTELRNQNELKMDFPAIDLADEARGLCVQVTSTIDRSKIQSTLDKFFTHGLDSKYRELLVLQISTERHSYQGSFQVSGEFRFDKERHIWNTTRLQEEIFRLDGERLRKVDQYLAEQLGWHRDGIRPMLLPMPGALGANRFEGRGTELEDMRRALKQGVRPLVLSGLGGMGKTELALHYARSREKGQVYFAIFRESFRDTLIRSVAPGIAGLKDARLGDSAACEVALERLKQCTKDDLLIIDNADRDEGDYESLKDEIYWQLTRLNMDVIITTRFRETGAIKVETLKQEELRRILRSHTDALKKEQENALIAAAEGHTLTVDLMARTLAQSWGTVQPEDILKALDEGNLAQKQFPAVYSDHDPQEDRRQERIYARLAALFDLSGIGEQGRTVLACATLLPVGGMGEALFFLALPEALRGELDSLEKRGWLTREGGMLRIHPMVRLVCRTELKPAEENCGDFLVGVSEQYDKKQYDAEKFRQMAELFENASEVLEDKTGNWAHVAGYFWGEVAENQRALKYKLLSVQKSERHQPGTNSLAASYNNVGYTYDALGDHQKALEYHRKALEIRERVLPEEHPDLAQSYNNVGSTYGDLGDHQKALAYQRKALEIRERVLPGDHPDLAASYNNVGSTYYALGDHKKALEYLLKALEIHERVLPKDHPDLALSYNNVGYTYGQMGNNVARLEYYLKALAIRERVLPGNHPDLALSCNNIAWTYYRLGQTEQAAAYMRRAAEIINRSSLPENHPKRVNYNKWADWLEQEARKPKRPEEPEQLKRRGWLARLFGK